MIEFLELIFEFILIGIGPYLWSKHLFDAKSVLHFLIISLIMGIVTLSLTVLTIGHFGGPVTGTALDMTKILLIACSLLYTIAFFRQNDFPIKKFTPCVSSIKKCTLTFFKSLLQYVPYVCIPAFSIVLFLVCSKVYTPAYDHFSFWLVDAKLIFTEGFLRSNSDVISLFTYSSFYPLHAVFLYEKFGYIVEQFSVYFTILYAFLASSLVYLVTWKRSIHTKLLTVLLLLILGFDLIANTLRFYGDISTSFYILLFAVVATLKVNLDLYHKKLFLLLTILFVILLIKSTNVIYSLIIFVFYFLYDRDLIMGFIKKVRIKPSVQVLFPFVLLLIAVLARVYYLEYIYSPSEAYTVQRHILATKGFSLSESFEQAKYLFKLIADDHPWVLLSLIPLILLFWKNRSEKNVFWLVCIMITLPMVNIVYYALSHRFSSIGRYVTTVFFLVPLLVPFFNIKIMKAWALAPIYIVLICLALYSGSISLKGYDQLLLNPNHTGRYTDSQDNGNIMKNAERTRQFIHDKPLVILSENEEKHFLHNTGLEIRVYRYFLLENTKGGDISVPLEDLDELLCDLDAQYLLIVSPGEEFAHTINTDVNIDSTTLLRIESCSPIQVSICDVDLL